MGTAVAWPDPGTDVTAAVSTPLTSSSQSPLPPREESISRSAPRGAVTFTEKPSPRASTRLVPVRIADRMYTTAKLNVWAGPGEQHDFLGLLPSGIRIGVTGRTQGPWAEIVRNDKSRWVTAAYLSPDKPEPEPKPEPAPKPSAVAPEADGGLSSAPCASGSEVESGITGNAIALHRAVCAQFPQITTYGGWRGDGEHVNGQAIDIMVSDQSLGQAIADWVRAYSSALHVNNVIWAQRIWTDERSSEGWRPMEDRGSPTANHYDHVHVMVY